MTENRIFVNNTSDSFYDHIYMTPAKALCKKVYKLLVERKSVTVDIMAKWPDHELHVDFDYFGHSYKITLDNKLRSFQYKMLHKIVFFNDKLYIFKLSETTMCTFCHESLDSMEHRFWSCKKTQMFWADISYWYRNIFQDNFPLSLFIIIFNVSGHQLVDFIILLGKYYIYQSFINGKNICAGELINQVKLMEKVELDIAIKNGKLNKHIQKWTILCTY